jgi:hypothetical protein
VLHHRPVVLGCLRAQCSRVSSVWTHATYQSGSEWSRAYYCNSMSYGDTWLLQY